MKFLSFSTITLFGVALNSFAIAFLGMFYLESIVLRQFKRGKRAFSRKNNEFP